MRHLKIYPYFIAMSIKGRLSYRIDAFIGIIGFITQNLATFFTMYFTLSAINSLDGFNLEMMGFLYGFLLIPKAIDHIFSDQIWQLSNGGITKGILDKYLIKPLNPLFQLVAEFIQLEGFGELILGIIFLCIFTPKINVIWHLSNVIPLIIIAFFTIFFFFSIKLIMGSLSFWTKRSIEFMTAVYSLSDFAKYPITIFNKVIKVIMLYIIPFSLIIFMPIKYLIEGKSLWLLTLSIAGVVILFLIIALTLWHFGLKRYESAGS